KTLSQGPAGASLHLHGPESELGEQLVHFHVMQLMDLLFLWVGATPHLHNLAVAMCNRYDSIPPGRPTNRYLSAITFKTQTVTSHYW
uniref:Uncharacterized protein n=2 Tax=Ursus TaxID=9639 RepID=A0A452VAZ5_URSMA